MTTTTKTFETISVDQLAPVTGGGIGTQIGSLFGPKGAQWGGIADSILGMIQGGGGGSSGGGSSGGGSGGGGGGGFAGILGNIGKLFSGGGGGGSSSSGGSGAPADPGAASSGM